jgi:hypothetical protein
VRKWVQVHVHGFDHEELGYLIDALLLPYQEKYAVRVEAKADEWFVAKDIIAVKKFSHHDVRFLVTYRGCVISAELRSLITANGLVRGSALSQIYFKTCMVVRSQGSHDRAEETRGYSEERASCCWEGLYFDIVSVHAARIA